MYLYWLMRSGHVFLRLIDTPCLVTCACRDGPCQATVAPSAASQDHPVGDERRATLTLTALTSVSSVLPVFTITTQPPNSRNTTIPPSPCFALRYCPGAPPNTQNTPSGRLHAPTPSNFGRRTPEYASRSSRDTHTTSHMPSI
jgi:hypothetical protein